MVHEDRSLYKGKGTSMKDSVEKGRSRKVELYSLSVFLAVAEARSFTNAAKNMGVSKSHISKEISSLERSLGRRVFIRTTRVVELTDYGRILLPGTQKLIRGFDNLLADASEYVSSQWAVDLGLQKGLREYFYRELTKGLVENDVGPATMKVFCQKLLECNVLTEDDFSDILKRAITASSQKFTSKAAVTKLLKERRFERIWTEPVAKVLAEILRRTLA